MKKLLMLAICFFVITTVDAQYFQTGQDPASIKWRQINTENFQLIYPDYYETQAQSLAQKLEYVYDYGSYSMAYKPSKISIILHTQTVKSNGLVAYAPKRSEFYTTPHQAIYPQDWLEQLAIHEFRHVVQIGKLNHELPKIIKLIFGQQGTALVFGAFLPWWFIEGDAVTSETVLGNYGRGRFPSFLMEHRAQLVEKGPYSYDKAYLGSYNSYVPNHYRLGYYMVANARERYGSELWEKAIKRVGEKPLSLNPFNKALKLETGFNKVQLYNSIFDSLSIEWKNADNNFKPALSKVISPAHKTYSNYCYNHWLNDSTIISYKTALNKIPAFVKINLNGEEEKILNPGFIFEESVSYRKNWITWAEQISNLRWTHSGRSLIQFYNISTKESLHLNPEYKAFAPSLSPDLNSVIVVETDFSSNNYLSVYRINDGKLMHRIQTKNNNYFFSPQWLNKEEILAVILTENGKRLTRFSLNTGEYTVLIDKDLGELKHLRISGEEVYFISSYDGKNAFYSFNLSSHEITLIYEPRFGASHPAINDSGKLLLSDYTADGFRLIQLYEPIAKPFNQIKKENYELAQNVAKQELGKVDFTMRDTMTYSSGPYRKAAHLLNIHSWAPVAVDVDYYEFEPGFSFMSQNKLSTAVTTFGYRWDSSEETGEFYANYEYKGWYPVFDFEISKGKRASNYWLINQQIKNGQVVSSDTSLQRYTFKETQLSADVTLPLNLSKGAYYRLLQPEVKYELTSYKKDNSTPETFSNVNYQSLIYRLYYYQLLRQSEQDVFPNFGFIVDGSFRHSTNGTKGLGNLTAGQAILYAPGLLPNHGIKIYSGIQNRESGELYYFSDVVSTPRGWGSTNCDDLKSLAINYKLPLINPDFSLGGITYIRRISANIFADYANLKGTYSDSQNLYQYNISSYGMELIGEINFLRFYAPVEIGVRTSYLKEAKEFSFDFLLSVDFTSL